MTESDRELLELAAKAVGGEYKNHALGGMYLAFPPNWNGVRWNPLTDDGDAFRLMVALRLWRDDPDICCVERVEDHNGDELSATRKAIVRAAAAIGETRP